MLVDETDSENESTFSETTQLPASPSPCNTPVIRRSNRTESPRSGRSVGNQSNRFSVQEYSHRFVSNVRASVHNINIAKHIKTGSGDNENIQQPQLIREEKQDNAIFRIYLKRSQKKTSTPPQSYLTIQKFAENPLLQNQSGTNSNPGELVYSAVEVYQLKAGTLEKIVECLTNKDGDLETVHMHILYATYRTYTNTRTLIDMILARYRAVTPASLDMTEDVRIKTLKNLSLALICLLTAYKEDFYEPPNYTTLIHLLANAIDDDLESQCQTLLDRFSTEGENAFQSDSDTSMHRVDNNNNSKNLYFDEDLYHQKGFSSDARRNFLDMSHVKVAEQLTIFDAELLTRVLPYECLTSGSNSTNRRGLNPNRSLTTVDKTIEQFNAVVNRVIATILKEKNEQIRARVIEKWIDIAHECRQLRNFSALTAILNGLQAGCTYRLFVAWKNVDANHCSIFKELKNVFDSSGPDRTQVRKIHDREGTAKYADITTAINATLGRKPRPNRRGDQENAMIGTVPYLGLYLSDLTYIDSANENYVNIDENDKSSQKLINFEKHRKIFEILAQIKLFQSVANAYRTLKAMPNFKQWFDNVQIQTEAENWQRSYQIQPREPVDNVDSPQPTKTHENPLIANRSRPLKAFPSQISLESLATANNQTVDVTAPSGGSSPSSSSLDKMSIASIRSFPQRQQSNTSTGFKSIHSNHSRSSSASSCLTNASSSQGYMSAQGSPTNSVINCTVNSIESNTLIAKVQLVGRNDLLYKKVRIGDNERTSSVLKSILEKFGLDPSIYECYCIEQQLPDRKIVLMDHCNVFYALARKSQDEQVDLTVREKTRQEREQTKNHFCPPTDYNRTPSGISVSSTHSR